MNKRLRLGKKFVGAYVDEWLHNVLVRRTKANNTSVSVEIVKILLADQGLLRLDKKGAIVEYPDSELVDFALKRGRKPLRGKSEKKVIKLIMLIHMLFAQANLILKEKGKPPFVMEIKKSVDG